MHISDQGRNEPDPKSKKCTFIGYGEDEFGYRIWDNENKKVIRCRDVTFNEKVMYKDMHKTDDGDSESESTFVDADDVPDNLSEEPNAEDPQPEETVGQNGAQKPDAPASMLRRSTRPPVPNSRYMNYMLLTNGGESESFDEACQSGDASKWEFAAKEEKKSLISNQTWGLAELPMGKEARHNKWVYRVKKEQNGSRRYRARRVVKGFQQNIQGRKDPADMLTKAATFQKLKLCATSIGLHA